VTSGQDAQAHAAVDLHRRPRWAWPNGARLAVWVVPNVEVFDPEFAIDGLQHNTFALGEREYGNRVGLGRIRALLERYETPATAAVNAAVAEIHPGLLRQCVTDGWEIMGHGYVNNRRLTTYRPDEEGDLIGRCLRLLEDVGGVRPCGWLSPGLQQTPQTEGHLLDQGITYVADHADDDQPHPRPAGDGRTILSIPYSTQVNDKAAYDLRMLTPDEFADLAIRQFDVLYAESARTALVYSLALHPYLSGMPHRVSAVDRILSHVTSAPGVWLTTGSQIIDAYVDVHGR
jgi:peptidoglycan/xylan/chitin deacetylase (PgdA/CDA1 family)